MTRISTLVLSRLVHRLRAVFLMVAAILLAAATPVPSDRIAVARTVAHELIQRLKAELQRVLKAEGPVAAIRVCSETAPRIAAELSRAHGWRITRVSDRYRNPLLGMPDAWEQRALTELATRLRAGAPPERLEYVEVVTEPTGRFLRYAKGLPTGGLCVACHGDPTRMLSALRAALAERYPHDRAVGFAPGELRGAVSIKIPLE